jgi:hypothetical protein
MHVKTNVKSGALNHNETLVRDAGKGQAPRAKARGLRVKTHVKAGATGIDNHNETLVRGGKKGKAPGGGPWAAGEDPPQRRGY